MGADEPLLFNSFNCWDYMSKIKPQILLTNDDGILSPGLWAAAAALSKLGFVTVTAPRDQSSGMGRSLPSTSDGIIQEKRVQVNGQEWSVYSVGGSPAQTVLYGVMERMLHLVSPSQGRWEPRWKPRRSESLRWLFHCKRTQNIICPILKK